MKEKIKEALELLRLARNNMSLSEYEETIFSLCENDGNVRYPLMWAGNVAIKTHENHYEKSKLINNI